jgi:hypothetical protein
VTPRTTIPLILALCCSAAAEDQLVPPPPPTTDPTVAPVPPPPPTTDPMVTPTADATAPAPVAPTPAGEAPRPAPVGGDQAAAAAGRAAAQDRSKSLSLRLQLDAGYDSNVLREDTNTPTSTNTEGIAIGGELHGTWRAIREPKGQLNFIGDLRYNNYPDESSADLGRASVAAFGLLRFGFIDPGAVVGLNRQWIDGEGAATILRGTLTATRLSPERSHFDSLSLDFYHVDYDDNDDASGVLTDLLLRHWWMPEAGNARRRVEATVMAGIYSADTDVESYSTIKPALGVLYRMGEAGNAVGVWDLHAQTSLEFRSYDDGIAGESAERQTVWDIGVAAERWFGTWFSAGPFLSYSIRQSTRDDRDYDRVQVGARLIADW